MNVLIIGSGGREHALEWKISQNKSVKDIYVLPGNSGTKNNVPLKVDDFKGIEKFCNDKSISLIVVGPEYPLSLGIVDYFSSSNIKVFGPDQKASKLECSKSWAKSFMTRNGVSTADYWNCSTLDKAIKISEDIFGKVVVKYDGLAEGKGVFLCSSVQEAHEAIKYIHNTYYNSFSIVLEDKLIGKEVSIIGITDSNSIKLFLPARDHKRLYDGDNGPNTGGMGAYCPVDSLSQNDYDKIISDIVNPTILGLKKENLNYKGFIYFGIILTDNGPKLLEYNVRLGDPEAEVLLPSLKSDLVEMINACFDGSLNNYNFEFNPGYFVDVVLTSGGYAIGELDIGHKILGLEQIDDDILIFHAGSKKDKDNIINSGGRVLNIVSRANNMDDALKSVYKACQKISFPNMHYRMDIGKQD